MRPHGVKKRGNGQGSVYKRGKGWEAAVTTYRDGVRAVRRKSGFSTKKAALEWLSKPAPVSGRNITFSSLYAEWSSVHFPTITKKRLQILEAAFRACPQLHREFWLDIGIKEMQAAVDALDPSKYYPRKNLKALFAGMAEHAIISGYHDKNFAQYVRLPPEPVPDKTPFSSHEVQLLWDDYNAGNDFTGSILIMLYTGMRCGELLAYDPAKIHLAEGYMMGGAKTQAGRAGEILIIDKIKPIVKKLLVDRGLPKTSDTAYRKKFDAALKRAGCKPHTPHECRHTTATLLAQSGVQPAIIQAIMRHTKYSQSAEYTHIGRDAKLDALSGI